MIARLFTLRLYTLPLFALTLLLLPSTGLSEQKKVLGPWDIHYIAFDSVILTKEVARQYQLRRSKYSAVVNISVLNSDDQKAQSVAIVGSATNLLGVKKKLSFKQVKEGTAIYSIAELSFANLETYRIKLNIQQGNEQQVLEFEHTFYVD